MTHQFAFLQAIGIFLAFIAKVVMEYFFPLSLSGWKGWLLFFICSLLFSLLLMLRLGAENEGPLSG